MKILIVCDHGNNRSVSIAQRLKYWGHDILTAGLETNDKKTLWMLYEWADRIITTSRGQHVYGHFQDKVQLWQIGAGVYPRPLNRELLKKIDVLMDEHADEYRPLRPVKQ